MNQKMQKQTDKNMGLFQDQSPETGPHPNPRLFKRG
jgi:hypothetical protein